MKQTSPDKVERPARSGFSSVYKTFTLDIGDGVSGPVRLRSGPANVLPATLTP
jgi:hypothetical protein